MSKAQKPVIRLGNEFLDEKTYIVEKSKALRKEFRNLKIEDKDTKALVKIARNGEELTDDADPRHVKMLEGIKADIAAGEERTKELAIEAEASKNKESIVLNAALRIDEADRPALDTKFNVGSNYVDISPEATDEEVAQKFAISVVMSDFSAWAIGDLGNALQDRGLENVIDQFCAQTGRSGSTIYGHMRLARAVAKDDRDQNILPTVYKELVFPKLSEDAKEDKKLKKELLKKAKKENWNSKEARSHADAARTIPAGKQGGDKGKKGRYLVVSVEDGGLVYSFHTEEQPWQDGSAQFDLKTAQVLAPESEAEDAKIDWLDLQLAD